LINHKVNLSNKVFFPNFFKKDKFILNKKKIELRVQGKPITKFALHLRIKYG